MRLTGLWQDAQQAAVAVRRLRDLMDCPPEPYEITPRRTRGGEGRIELDQLGFRYAPGRAVGVPRGQPASQSGASCS